MTLISAAYARGGFKSSTIPVTCFFLRSDAPDGVATARLAMVESKKGRMELPSCAPRLSGPHSAVNVGCLMHFAVRNECVRDDQRDSNPILRKLSSDASVRSRHLFVLFVKLNSHLSFVVDCAGKFFRAVNRELASSKIRSDGRG